MSQSPVWRALRRSILIAAVLLALPWSLITYEYFFVPPGEGYLNSDERPEDVPADKVAGFADALKYMAIELGVLTFVIFMVQVPSLLARESRR